MKFEDMNIETDVLRSLEEIGFSEPTRIQREAIPLIKDGKDVVGQSETGSGKTAAFGIPIVEKVARNGKAQALILVPTRELCLQITQELRKISQFKGLHVSAIYGGAPLDQQAYELRKTEIIVGTPGRIFDHLSRGNLRTDDIKIFVIDEADKMVDMGFFDDIKKIGGFLPERQTLMFSATMPENLFSMTKHLTRNATRIKTETKVREDILEQYYYDVSRERKFSLLIHLIKTENPDLAIVFCNSRRDANAVYRNLRRNDFNASLLHGGLKQSKREEVINAFHKGYTKILVATDVAARGLDVKNVSHVFNYSIPNNTEDYVNRIGRTARAGKSGKAISLISRDDHEAFRKVINTYSFEIKKMNADFEDVKFYYFNKSNDKRRMGTKRRFH
jgi:ATP-dependent RNA helicase DeaD